MIGTLRQVDPPVETAYENIIAFSEDVEEFFEFTPAFADRTLLMIFRPVVGFQNDGLHVTGYAYRPLGWDENSPDGYQKISVIFTPLRPATLEELGEEEDP